MNKKVCLLIVFVLVLANANAFCFMDCKDFKQHAQENHDYIQGCRFSVDSSSHTFGITWGDVGKKVPSCNICSSFGDENLSMGYVEWISYDDKNVWEKKGLADLGRFGIGIGCMGTLFGHTGIQPIVGFRTVNFQKCGFQLGLTWIGEEDGRAYGNTSLYYDFLTERVILSFAGFSW